MVWTEQWTLTLDGTSLNNHTDWDSYIPEIDNGFSGDVILVQIAGDTPYYVRVQPREGKFNLLVQMRPCSAATFRSRFEALKALLTPGLHTLVVQVRGMADAKTYSVISDGGWIVDYKGRRVAATLTVLAQV